MPAEPALDILPNGKNGHNSVKQEVFWRYNPDFGGIKEKRTNHKKIAEISQVAAFLW